MDHKLDRRSFVRVAGGTVAAGSALLGAACDDEQRSSQPRVFFADPFQDAGDGLGHNWMSVRYLARARRSGHTAIVDTDVTPGRVTGGRPFAEYLGEPFVVVRSHVSECRVNARVRLRGLVEAGVIARWSYDLAYALLISPDAVLLCRYSPIARRVLDSAPALGDGWWNLQLEVAGGTLRARVRRGRRRRLLEASDDSPLGPGLVGMAVNPADPDGPAAAEFRSFSAASPEAATSLPPEFAYRFCGAVTAGAGGDYEARLSARTVLPREVSFEVAPDSSFEGARTIGPVRPSGRFGAVRATVAGLDPGRRYFWRPAAGDGGEVVRGRPATFRTPSAPDRPVRFAFASCTSGRVESYPSFRVAAGMDPELYLHAGDWGYANLNSLAHRADHFQARWTRLFRENNVDALLSKTPLLFWQDDHDYQSDNGWAKTVKGYAVEAFDEIHANPTDEYFDVRWGDVHIFCLDCRLYASDPDAPDDARKTRLGRRQRAWLEKGLARTDAPVVVVASAMAFRNKSADDPGWHNVYTVERDHLLAVFSSLDATVVILSGDSHGHRLIHHFEFGELYEITASGTDFPSSIHWGQVNHDPEHTLVDIADRTGFAVVDLDAAGPGRRLTVRSVSAADGSTMFEKSLRVG